MESSLLARRATTAMLGAQTRLIPDSQCSSTGSRRPRRHDPTAQRYKPAQHAPKTTSTNDVNLHTDQTHYRPSLSLYISPSHITGLVPNSHTFLRCHYTPILVVRTPNNPLPLATASKRASASLSFLLPHRRLLALHAPLRGTSRPGAGVILSDTGAGLLGTRVV